MGMRVMPTATDPIDPFGAQEYYINDITREEVEPGVIRILASFNDGSDRIIKVKLIMSTATLDRASRECTAFLADINVYAPALVA